VYPRQKPSRSFRIPQDNFEMLQSLNLAALP
jgi:hypothetical protein